MRYRLIIIGVLVEIFIPLAGQAAQTSFPEFNPVCWQQKACEEQRAAFFRKDPDKPSDAVIKGGWRPGEEPCAKPGWGKCLPAGDTFTEISFGGQRRFSNIGIFIQQMYKYALVIAGIVAVVVIIVGGFQWTLSGGNSEMISSAQKRITGAVVGLLIAYLSYFILNTVNPALVNFRLPRIWMLRDAKLIPTFCGMVPQGKYAVAAEKDNQTSSPTQTADFTKALTYTDPEQQKQFECGRRFFISEGSNQTCFGDICGYKGTCLNVDLNKGEPTNKYECVPAKLAGRITNSSVATLFGQTGCFGTQNGWETPEVVDTGLTEGENSQHQGSSTENEFWLFCKDKKTWFEFNDDKSTIFTKPGFQFYYSNFDDSVLDSFVASSCGSSSNVRGFLIKMEMNQDCCKDDENHLFGYDPDTLSAIDVGDDAFIVHNVTDNENLTKNAMLIDDKYFISSDQLKKGLRFDIEASTVRPIQHCSRPDLKKDSSDDPSRSYYKRYLRKV